MEDGLGIELGVFFFLLLFVGLIEWFKVWLFGFRWF